MGNEFILRKQVLLRSYAFVHVPAELLCERIAADHGKWLSRLADAAVGDGEALRVRVGPIDALPLVGKTVTLDNHAVRTLCRVLQVSRAAYYRWSIHPLSAHATADLALSERIAAIHTRSRQTYGAPRVHAELRICGERHSRKRIARLMRRASIAGRVPRRYRRSTAGDPFTVLPDLVHRDFAPTHPDELWVGDITYVRTWEGWLYLRCTWGWHGAIPAARSFTTPTGAVNTRLKRTPTSSQATASVPA